MKNPLIKFFAAVMTFVLTASCFSLFDPDDENSKLDPVADKWDAEDLVERIADNVINDHIQYELSSTSPSGEIVYGLSGTARVSGTASSSNNDCGTDCISSTTSADLEIYFDDFRASTSDNCEMTLTGSVDYYYYYYTRQSGLSFSSDKSISVSGTNVEVYWICDESWGLEDEISFSASGDSEYDLSGWCTNGKGTRFDF